MSATTLDDRVQQVIESREVKGLVARGWMDWRELVAVVVVAYERTFTIGVSVDADREELLGDLTRIRSNLDILLDSLEERHAHVPGLRSADRDREGRDDGGDGPDRLPDALVGRAGPHARDGVGNHPAHRAAGGAEVPRREPGGSPGDLPGTARLNEILGRRVQVTDGAWEGAYGQIEGAWRSAFGEVFVRVAVADSEDRPKMRGSWTTFLP